VKRASTGNETTFANHLSDKKTFIQNRRILTTQQQKTNNPILKWATGMKRHFSKKYTNT
jgi:hypothetical protein